MSLAVQVATLFVLAIPIACVAWTVTHEEVFREPREFCVRRSEELPALVPEKILLSLHLRILLQPLRHSLLPLHHALPVLYEDWRGYLVGGFALVWVANQYMSLYNRLRLDIKSEKIETASRRKWRRRSKGMNDKSVNREP